MIPLTWPVTFAEGLGSRIDPVSTRIHGVGILRFRQTLERGGKLPTAVAEYEHEEATVTESETE